MRSGRSPHPPALPDTGILASLSLATACQITQFQLGHAAALFFGHQVDVNTVVLEIPCEIFTRCRAVVVAVAGDIEGNFAGGVAHWFECRLFSAMAHSLAHGLAVDTVGTAPDG